MEKSYHNFFKYAIQNTPFIIEKIRFSSLKKSLILLKTSLLSIKKNFLTKISLDRLY